MLFCRYVLIESLQKNVLDSYRAYRADDRTQYDHIGTLFSGSIDWALIESHWQDLMQVVLSIQAGKISSALLLRKLGNESRKNRLYRVAREVGRVIRTIFLLDWISNLPLRRAVTETTNKIESYNGFAKWISFGLRGRDCRKRPGRAAEAAAL